jgi:hypothetical protein
LITPFDCYDAATHRPLPFSATTFFFANYGVLLVVLKDCALRKVTHLTAQKRAAMDWLKRLMAFSTFIITSNPIGTVIAI